MAIDLKKTQTINLRKPTADSVEFDLSTVSIGLGWDIADGTDYDLDACALVLSGDTLESNSDVVSYKNQKHSTGCVWSSGDNLTGAGDGDDETIFTKLNQLPEKYNKIVVYATIYQGHNRGQHFGGVKGAFMRAIDANGKEIARYSISQSPELSGSCSFVFGELNRGANGWEFKALGEAHKTSNLDEVAALYGARKKVFGLF